MTTTYSAEVIRRDAAGNISIDLLTITDDDRNLETGEPGTTWTLNGVVIPVPPVDFATATGDIFGFSGFGLGGVSFDHAGSSYFLPGANCVERVLSIDSITLNAPVGGIAYNSLQMSPVDAPARQAQALVIGTLPQFAANSVQTVTIYDDDGVIDIIGQTAEDGGTPLGIFGDSSNNFDVNISDAGSFDTVMVLVRVSYDSDSGPGIFQAIKFTTFGQIFYVPREGSVDLSDGVVFVSETLLNPSLDGERWEDFGLGSNRVDKPGTAAADMIEGEFINDLIDAGAGTDTILGAMGDDRIRGQSGGDLLFGGVNADVVSGNSGSDSVFGGSGDDTLDGGGGGDALEGFFGRDDIQGNGGEDTLTGGGDGDLLKGGADDDVLEGGSGNDTLEDGTGRDDLTGGAGFDVFVMSDDATRDTIFDFRDGVDLIDLSVGFGALTITDIAPGQVRVTDGSDTLMIFGNGALTAADLTNADFI